MPLCFTSKLMRATRKAILTNARNRLLGNGYAQGMRQIPDARNLHTRWATPLTEIHSRRPVPRGPVPLQQKIQKYPGITWHLLGDMILLKNKRSTKTRRYPQRYPLALAAWVRRYVCGTHGWDPASLHCNALWGGSLRPFPLVCSYIRRLHITFVSRTVTI